MKSEIFTSVNTKLRYTVKTNGVHLHSFMYRRSLIKTKKVSTSSVLYTEGFYHLACILEMGCVDNVFFSEKIVESSSDVIRAWPVPLIRTQIVPRSPQFGFRRPSRSPYRFTLSLKGPHNGSLKSKRFSLGHSRSPYILSLIPSLT
ncbi:hypothetical protein TNCV_5071421 [Trichonephila clavipes]|nr:hypothetical protein TNCV_5071421 [Trichonephila clavipes]